MTGLAKSSPTMGIPQPEIGFEEIFESEFAETKEPFLPGTRQSFDETISTENDVQQSKGIMSQSFDNVAKSKGEVKNTARLGEENEGGVTEPPPMNLQPPNTVPRTFFEDRSYPGLNLPMSYPQFTPSGSQTLSVPESPMIPPGSIPTSTPKPSTVPSTSEKVYVSLPQTQQSSALTHGHTQAHPTPYCGVHSNEITRPPTVRCSFDDLMVSPYSCARCGKLIKYTRSMRRHFVHCVKKYGNPHGVRWVDHGDYSAWFHGETGGTTPSLVQGMQATTPR